MPKLSVIIPVYNLEKYVEKCLDSVTSQNGKDLEIIVVDDGSADHTGQICDDFGNKYDNITVYHKRNGGLSDARNYGIKRASGDYITFLDGDDFLAPNAIENILNNIKTHRNVDVVIGRYINYYPSTGVYEECGYHLREKVIEHAVKEALFRELFRGKTYDWYACIHIVRRKYLIENNLYFKEGACFEDALWTPKVLFEAERVSYIDKPFYIYLQNRKGSITASLNEKVYRDKQYVCQYAQEFGLKYGLSENMRKRFLGNSNRTYVSLLADSWQFKKEKRKKYWKELEGKKKILLYSGRRYQRWLYRLWGMIGIRGVSYILYLRAEWVRKKYNEML